MKVLSVKQPWAWLICSGIKNIENRSWKLPEKMKGQRVLIHASAKMDTKNPISLLNDRQSLSFSTPEKRLLLYDSSTVRSAIIGSVEIVDCVINHESIWAEKTNLHEFKNSITGEYQYIPIYNWVLTNPVLFENPIMNVKGKLNFWEYQNTLEEPSGVIIE